MTTQKPPKDALLDAALHHVPFDGWSAVTFEAALKEAAIERGLAIGLFPRGAVDLALAYHARGDARMRQRIADADNAEMRYRDRIAQAVRFRIEAAGNREVVRKGAALFAMPRWAPDGARAIWGTADTIWTALGDTSEDINWYTKRATLSAVYASTLLYWLGDETDGHSATWEFLDRRIEDVMQIEKAKAAMRDNKMMSALMAGPNQILAGLRRPPQRRDYPGQGGMR